MSNPRTTFILLALTLAMGLGVLLAWLVTGIAPGHGDHHQEMYRILAVVLPAVGAFVFNWRMGRRS